MPERLVLLSGDGHTWIALDYRNVAENPPVIFIDNEFEEIIELAPNFESFLQNLTTYEYDRRVNLILKRYKIPLQIYMLL